MFFNDQYCVFSVITTGPDLCTVTQNGTDAAECKPNPPPPNLRLKEAFWPITSYKFPFTSTLLSFRWIGLLVEKIVL